MELLVLGGTSFAVAALGPHRLAGPYVLISSVSAYAEPQAHAETEVVFTEEREAELLRKFRAEAPPPGP